MMLENDASNSQERDGRGTIICIQMRALPLEQIKREETVGSQNFFITFFICSGLIILYTLSTFKQILSYPTNSIF